ncbi:MAG: hypothetical protein DA329_01150 [Candidatus Nitrosocosmicus sp.]|nr:hypothetical protein [Candidatus Nitrosocosmicus sp.]
MNLFRNKLALYQDLVSEIGERNGIEKVLILQGGGSSGAFGCGVFKSIKKWRINLDIVADTSIGGIMPP